ncbi:MULTISPECIES: flagellar biosynthesis protein FlhA [Treponema]|jgi:flagellar biosynthesis protein flhA|uniref:Flagellar biosynthesis protein FlhA n=4 Tax=Treponema denticola TaxID=158 RepID=Q73RN3_TREDE|nr:MULTISPECIES: flagellar biosynthesis protein FlhA [Treponema]AAS10553.1 flagellar biosynthesis protein FlhA [Treponema denticola ATCC 35405]EMB21460.1 flagellar biosynthesis protein FlhA [Treponema denticola OTK]EMB32301.1 flagellar biosynthesis protein FlhA [Treponema denticola MYR-T]EMB32710.1 flagellar biosynthesis protein FlhA [Treponema denticola H1-T]EMB33127.1 flagellar biosynthesis protein FlhA [Treponema denticola H-22]
MAENRFFKEVPNALVAIGAIMVIFVIIIPLPTALLDFFMALNLIFSLIILLIVLFVDKPTEFTVFPSLLLVSTIFGLALNVSSTRLILTYGEKFNGKMIAAFSQFVIGSTGNQGLVIGFVVFIILIAVQAFVITKGATRIAEVAARFALDFNNTRSMSIEAEYNAGVITEAEARKKKEELQRSTDFYGAMDGASKFVSGNVKIGIFITVLNIVAGLIVGIVFRQEEFTKAMQMYTRFTIGDGLLAQLPSLFISVATGLVVTRSASTGSFGKDITDQFARNSTVYYIAAITLTVMAVLPGFPSIILIIIALSLAFLGWRLQTTKVTRAQKEQAAKEAQAASEKAAKTETDDTKAVSPYDDLSLQFGYGLIPLVDEKRGSDLVPRVKRIRKEIALETGLVMPVIRMMDAMNLPPDEYCITIQGAEVARSKIRMGAYLAVNPGNVQDEIPGEPTLDPAFGLPAIWISESNQAAAERAGYTVIDPPSIIATHLTQVIKTHADDILSRQMVSNILDSAKKLNPIVVEEIQSNDKLTLGDLQTVFKCLLRENVSIRNTTAILETISDYRRITGDMYLIAEKVRQRLGRQIVQQYLGEDKALRAFMVDSAFFQTVLASRIDTLTGPQPAIDTESKKAWLRAVQNAYNNFNAQFVGIAVILVPEEGRLLIKRLLEYEMPMVPVLSVPEIPKDISVIGMGNITPEIQ